ncbi:hypothetical protein GCM10023160_15900 [Brachybacterium paraconglomeratum]|uniref:PEP/pyruvate-binding domain-containing protein n=1 Tax=Brachybacterium paraconglomeratum TaxID=173362 RepID=UPI0031E9A22E
MIHDLRDAQLPQSGGKAAALGSLLRAGIDIPPGIVVPVREYHRHLLRARLDPGTASPTELRAMILQLRLEADLVRALESRLRCGSEQALGDLLAVRSTATSEDGTSASAAGQHDSVLAVRGTDAVCAAILRCWASLWSERAVAYRCGEAARHGDAAPDDAPPQMAVIVQQFLDADVSGVLFTGEQRVLEAIRGRGEQLVGGEVTPDSWRIDEGGIQSTRAGSNAQGVCLNEAQVHALDALGARVSRILGAPADIEWTLVGDRFQVLQARPITAAVPGPRPEASPASEIGTLQGTPASGGSATGTARTVRGPQDFRRVRQGDVLICRSTDPAWTPLFRIAGAVVTEVGGVLSHAAIVARELGIPAVLAVPGALAAIPDGSVVTVHGDEGLIASKQAS